MTDQPTSRPAGSDAGSSSTRARTRPAGVTPPAHWQSSTVPVPYETDLLPAEEQPEGRNPVRYGDWEYKGLAIDF